MSGFIALHLGAGYHAENKRRNYKSICNRTCKVAIDSLKQNSSAISVVSHAVSQLEDSPLTNAGTGSNLTLDGTVECDAAIMDGKTLNFGSVGAIYGIKNPIKVAEDILNTQKNGILSFGRIPPCTLVSKGAVQWAKNRGFKLVDPNVLITETSRKNYSKCKSLLDNRSKKSSSNKVKAIDYDQVPLDTVGALCIDMDGNIASAVSSGGLLLKHSGRIGQAAAFGAGCWAQNQRSSSESSIAVSVSGAGEYLVRTLLAKECYNSLQGSIDSFMTLPDIFRQKFVESPYLQNISSKLAGVLSLIHDHKENTSELSWAHNTKTFLIGYMSVLEDKPHSLVSEQTGTVSSDNIVACGRKITHSSLS